MNEVFIITKLQTNEVNVHLELQYIQHKKYQFKSVVNYTQHTIPESHKNRGPQSGMLPNIIFHHGLTIAHTVKLIWQWAECSSAVVSHSVSLSLTTVGTIRANRMGVEIETISPGDGKMLWSKKFEFQIPKRSIYDWRIRMLFWYIVAVKAEFRDHSVALITSYLNILEFPLHIICVKKSTLIQFQRNTHRYDEDVSAHCRVRDLSCVCAQQNNVPCVPTQTLFSLWFLTAL